MVLESESPHGGGGSEDPASLAAARPAFEALRLRHLKLDRPTLADAADIVFLAHNRKIAEMLARMPHPYTIEDARKWIEAAANPVPGTAMFAVRLRSTGRLIGACGYTFSQLDFTPEPQLGYWIGEPFWGRGYATEAAQAAIDHAFAASAHEEMATACRITNSASRRVLEKCGFQYRDRGMMRSVAHGGGAVPVETYRLDRKGWEALKGWRRLA